MAIPLRPIPARYHSVTPYLCANGAADAKEFYKTAFGAEELIQMSVPEGDTRHAEVQIGDSRIMLSDEVPEMNFRRPKMLRGTPVKIYLYVEDVDSVVAHAAAAEAEILMVVAGLF